MKDWFSKLIDEDVTFETERLIIHPLKIDLKSFEDLYEIYSSASNVSGYCPRHISFASSAEYLKNKIEKYQYHFKTTIMYAYKVKETNKIIGLRNIIFDVRPTNIPGKIIEYSDHNNLISETIINQKYWNQGFSFEASTEIYNELKARGASNILAFIPNNNLKSKHLNAKMGFNEVSLKTAFTKYLYFEECVNNTVNAAQQSIYIKSL